jgi:hypothetical protein
LTTGVGSHARDHRRRAVEEEFVDLRRASRALTHDERRRPLATVVVAIEEEAMLAQDDVGAVVGQ